MPLIQRALSQNPLIPVARIHVSVSAGWVILSGTVNWAWQRRSAEAAVWSVPGVIGLTNDLIATNPTAAYS